MSLSGQMPMSFVGQAGIPCTHYSLENITVDPDLLERSRSFIEKDFNLKLPADDAANSIIICPQKLRDYDKKQLAIIAFLGSIYFNIGDFDVATVILEELLLFGEEMQEPAAIALAHNYLANIANDNDFKLSAYFHNQKLLEVSSSPNISFSKVGAYLNWGVEHFDSGEHQAAEQNYQTCLQILQEEPDDYMRSWVWHRLGELNRVKENYQQAIYYLEKAINFWLQINDLKGVCYTYLQLGKVYQSMNDSITAEDYFQKALDVSVTSNHHICQAEARLDLGAFYLEQGKDELAISIIEPVLNNGEQKEGLTRQMSAHQMIAKIYASRGDYEKANKNHEAFLFANEKYNQITTENNAKSIQNVERLILQKKEYELLKQTELYMQDRLILQRLTSGIFLIGLVISCGLTFLFFRKNQKNKAQKEALQMLNHKNRQQAEALEQVKIITENQKKELEVEMVKKALILSQQGAIIQTIAQKLETMDSNAATDALRREVSKVKDNNLWKEMNLQITQSNKVLFEKLLQKYPTLTPTELRLCALLKMNMSTKEIANLTFKNPDSVKVARSRLRKKLGLTHSNITFTTFLSRVGQEDE